MDFLEEFGNRIRKYRQKKGYTQEELAFKMGYTSRSTINKIEKGLIDVPQSKIEEFAKYLDVSPWDLMGWNNKEWHEKVDLKMSHQKLDINISRSNDDYFKLKIKIENESEVTIIVTKSQLQTIIDTMTEAILL